MVVGIITTILGILSTVIGGAVTVGKEVVAAISSVIQAVYSVFQTFVQSAPTPMKVLIFLTFILTIGNIFSNFYLGTRYLCNAGNVLYENSNTVDAIASSVRLHFFSYTVKDRQDFIQEHYTPAQDAFTPTRVQCVNQEPKLFFYSVNILDYKLWLLILLITFGVPMILNYYTKMGALH